MEAVAEPSNRKIFSATLEFLAMTEKYRYRNGKTSIEISELDFRTQPIIFPIKHSSPFYEVFEEKIQNLIEAGLCPHRLSGHVVSTMQRLPKRFDEEIPPLVLSMGDLNRSRIHHLSGSLGDEQGHIRYWSRLPKDETIRERIFDGIVCDFDFHQN